MEMRMDPDRLLKAITEEENKKNRGHLHIFFGYAAGVGKTYAMLKAAHAAKRHNIDVVAGYVEPHMRPATTALLNGLEMLPCQEIEYNGIRLREFDLDAALRRRPQLILVDELAHTNAQGCRHVKRYQDVEELLNAGIDVYTTVNVQHIESLCDMVASITNVVVHERIPDRIFDNAYQVKLVDIEPEELITRLNEGKVYQENQAQKAVENFFTIENLTALREIALRRCADRVNKLSENARIKSKSDYYTDEHILVCLSSSPTNAKIIRTAARMARAFNGNFTALFVETPSFSTMSEENRKRLRNNMHLAEQLGAMVETTYGEDIALQISEYARVAGISKIVLGRSSARKKAFLGKQALTEKLIAYAPNLDIYIIPDSATVAYQERKAQKKRAEFRAGDVAKSAGVLLAATLIGFAFSALGFSEVNIITVYILGVLVTAVVTSRRVYSLVFSVLSVLVFNFFFTEPIFTLNAYNSGYPATFLITFIAAFITSSLAVRIKQNARQAARMAYRTKVLLDTNQMLQQAKDKYEIVAITANQLIKLLRRDIIFYFAEDGFLGDPITYPCGEREFDEACISENERAVASWVLKNNKHAGVTTATLANAKCLYLAVRVGGKVYGVVGIVMGETELDSFENSIMLSILGECALGLENEQTAFEKEQTAILAKNEQLRANLLRSISHDLRTPLTSISGNAGILLSDEESIPPAKRRELYGNIYDDSLWLINLVENLLSVTRIEDGTMKLRMTTELLDEIIGEAMQHIDRRSSEHNIQVKSADSFVLVKVDARLIMQVIINLVDNAIKYTPAGSDITIETATSDSWATVTVADNGGGISDDAKTHIFDMFYTGDTKVADSRRSLGLGLALCKSIVAAHGGKITVSDNKPHGAVFAFTLPIEEVTLHE